MPKVLVLTPRFPFSSIGGDRVRISTICQALAETCEITVASLAESGDQAHAMKPHYVESMHVIRHSKLSALVNTTLALPTKRPLQNAYYYNRRFARLVRDLVESHDLVIAHLIRAGQYIEHLDGKPKILEMTDAISLNYRRIADKGAKRGLKAHVFAFD